VTANVLASLATPPILLGLPEGWLEAVMMSEVSADEYRMLAALLSAVLLLSHADVFTGWLKSKPK
jgi:hypothetical protein